MFVSNMSNRLIFQCCRIVQFFYDCKKKYLFFLVTIEVNKLCNFYTIGQDITNSTSLPSAQPRVSLDFFLPIDNSAQKFRNLFYQLRYSQLQTYTTLHHLITLSFAHVSLNLMNTNFCHYR